ncbi:MAG: UvrD-helicase domain-containing protein, partial [Lachnospiraceae bacterium]|nr:UvrD-helicase domain-containing protein [Lachnospiraceae bacterium]
MTEQEFFNQYGQRLNNQQREAVVAVEGPLLLLAVPGSGKTTVLVTRLGFMILVKGISPESILTLTYTVAAAADMKRRFAALFTEELAERLEFRTINGVCQKIIT